MFWKLKGLPVFILCFILTGTAQATPPSQEQQQIDLACVNAFIAADPNLALQNQIVALCPAGNPGNQFTGTDLSRQRFDEITSVLSDVTNARLRRIALNRPGNQSNYGSLNSDFQDYSGINAGDLFENYGVWGNFSRNWLDNEFINTPFDSSTNSFLLGADILPLENMVLGLAIGYEDSDVDTPFNTGDQDIDGYTVAGYFGYLFNDYLSMDISGGYSGVDIEQTRLNNAFGALLPTSPFFGVGIGTPIKGEVDADRWFVAANLNGYWRVRNFILEGQAGYLRAKEMHDSFTETTGTVSAIAGGRDFELGQWRLGVNVAYDFRSSLEPYFGVYYLNETTMESVRVSPGLRQPSNDDDEFLFSIGMRYFGNHGITGDAQWNFSTAREDIDAHTLMLILRADF